MFEIWPFLPPLKIFPFLEDVRLETTVLWLVRPFSLYLLDSTYFLTLLTITLKQFIPDHKRRNRNRNRYGNKKETLRSLRLQLPRLRRYAAFHSAYDNDFLSTLRIIAPYHYDCNYEASVNQA